MKKTRYYGSFTEDFVQSREQQLRLSSEYRYVRTDGLFRVVSAVVYMLALALSAVYCRVFLRMRIRGREKLRVAGRQGVFLYGNHTQPVGDVFTPAHCLFPRRIYTLASPANYGIPVIGRLLPYLGALPVADTVQGLRTLQEAVALRLEQGKAIVIYPEAHVWEYYTGLRPFAATAFKFPAKFDKPVFSMTVTYQRTRWRKRPKMVVYLDGPFFPEGETLRERAESLRQAVRAAMEQRVQLSDTEYIAYRPRDEGTSADAANHPESG